MSVIVLFTSAEISMQYELSQLARIGRHPTAVPVRITDSFSILLYHYCFLLLVYFPWKLLKILAIIMLITFQIPVNHVDCEIHREKYLLKPLLYDLFLISQKVLVLLFSDKKFHGCFCTTYGKDEFLNVFFCTHVLLFLDKKTSVIFIQYMEKTSFSLSFLSLRFQAERLL